MNDDFARRITQHITTDGSAIIPPRIARYLEREVGMTADRRIKLRDSDPDAYVAFAALHLAALSSESGTNYAAPHGDTPQLDMWMSTNETAKALNRTDRCIRKWCANGQLHAVMTGGRWLINPNTLALQHIA